MRLFALATLALTLAACDSGTTPDPLPDTTPPVVQIISPANGARITGLFQVQYTATGAPALRRERVLLDGQEPTYAFGGIDSARYPNGPHALVAQVDDAAGNVGTSPVVTVTFAN